MPVLRHIYDSATGTYHDVEVTQEVYDFYRRNAWAIRRQNTRFYAHEIQFSSLIGGKNCAFENFAEFLSFCDDPQLILCQQSSTLQLQKALKCLSLPDKHLLYFLIVEGLSERRYGQWMGLHHMTIHNRKKSILMKLKKQLS